MIEMFSASFPIMSMGQAHDVGGMGQGGAGAVIFSQGPLKTSFLRNGRHCRVGVFILPQ